jgi:hypothetical protein
MFLEKYLASVLTSFFNEEMFSVIGSISSRSGRPPPHRLLAWRLWYSGRGDIANGSDKGIHT